MEIATTAVKSGIGVHTDSDRWAAIVIPIGPGKTEALDTLDSVERYCPEPHIVVAVDDCTQDGTYEALCEGRRPNWHILRNDRPMGIRRLVHTLSLGYRFVLSKTDCELVLRLDQDALLIASGVIRDAANYAQQNPAVGLFGVYEHDYNRPRSFGMHKEQIRAELGRLRRLLGVAPSWEYLFKLAEERGYIQGENVFGGAYFVTRQCLEGMDRLGALEMPFRWRSKMMEDVYFSMAAVAADFKLGHFGAPEGPLCLEWRGLPYVAEELIRAGYKVVHSVDKGKNTDRQSNGGKTAREVFRIHRTSR